jgi:zinc transporter
MEAIFDRFSDAVARSTATMRDTLDSIEDHIVSDHVERERARLIPVRRTAVRFHRQLASLSAILRDWEEHEEEGTPSALRLATGRLLARVESLDQEVLGVQERAKLLQDEVSARLAEETNRSLKALSEMTALLLPGSLVASIFGMNVHGLPFLDTEGGFVVVMLVGMAATAGFYWLLRRRGA